MVSNGDETVQTLEQLFDAAPPGVSKVRCVFHGLFSGGEQVVEVRRLSDNTIAFKRSNGVVEVPEKGTSEYYQIARAWFKAEAEKRADAAISNLTAAQKRIEELEARLNAPDSGGLGEAQQELEAMRGQLQTIYQNYRAELTPVVAALEPLATPEEKDALKAAQDDVAYCNTAFELVAKHAPRAVGKVAEAGKLQGELATAQSKAITLQQILDGFGGTEKIKALKAFDEERTQIMERLEAAEERAKAYEGLPDPKDIRVVLEEAAKRGTAPQQKYVIIDVGEEKVSVPARYVDLVRQQLALAARAAELEKAGYKTPADVKAALDKAVKKPEARAAGLEQALGVYRAIDADPSALQKKVAEYNATRTRLESELKAATDALQLYEQTGLNAGEMGEIADANKGLVTRVKELEQKLAAAAAAPQGAPAQLQAPAPQPQPPAPQGPAAPQAPVTAYAYRGGLFASTTVHYDGRDITGYPVGNQFLDSKTGKPAELPPEIAARAIKYHNAKGKTGKLM